MEMPPGEALANDGDHDSPRGAGKHAGQRADGAAHGRAREDDDDRQNDQVERVEQVKLSKRHRPSISPAGRPGKPFARDDTSD